MQSITALPRLRISLDQIDINSPKLPNHRAVAEDEKLIELADNIKIHGMINEPIVWGGEAPGEWDQYILIAGERRTRAAKILVDRGQIAPQLEVKVFYGSEESAEFIAFIDNIERKDLTPYEKAAKLADLQKKYGYSADQLAEKLKRDRTQIFLDLQAWGRSSDELLDAWRRGLPTATVYELAKLDKEAQPKQVAKIEAMRAKGGKKARGAAHRAARSASGGSVRATPAEMKLALQKIDEYKGKHEERELSEYERGVLKGMQEMALYAQGEMGVGEFEMDIYNG